MDFEGAEEALRHEAVDIYNRLHSLNEDANFVTSVADAYNFPLVRRSALV
jgi:tRNA A64-2'-O-ribosylphosphate transferase